MHSTLRSRRSTSVVWQAISRRKNSACAPWSPPTFANTSATRSVSLILKANNRGNDERGLVHYSRRRLRQLGSRRDVQLRPSTRLASRRRRDAFAERSTGRRQDDAR